MQNEKNYDNVITLIIDILKAVVLFVFRLVLLIPMIVITIFGATLGGSEASLTYGIGKCIKHPFKAFGEAIRNISYAIKNYRNNRWLNVWSWFYKHWLKAWGSFKGGNKQNS